VYRCADPIDANIVPATVTFLQQYVAPVREGGSGDLEYILQINAKCKLSYMNTQLFQQLKLGSSFSILYLQLKQFVFKSTMNPNFTSILILFLKHKEK